MGRFSAPGEQTRVTRLLSRLGCAGGCGALFCWVVCLGWERQSCGHWMPPPPMHSTLTFAGVSPLQPRRKRLLCQHAVGGLRGAINRNLPVWTIGSAGWFDLRPCHFFFLLREATFPSPCLQSRHRCMQCLQWGDCNPLLLHELTDSTLCVLGGEL